MRSKRHRSAIAPANGRSTQEAASAGVLPAQRPVPADGLPRAAHGTRRPRLRDRICRHRPYICFGPR
ncbi:hypothetical protein WG70_05795 [Burkholderia oklahomensis EO147]|nr:hypothetical protein WG70_05795 [Burkholderia oklahomensis EO147]KUY51666.1 hypothetical protein WG70_15345 [Burkholderia oklahomensis EO147]